MARTRTGKIARCPPHIRAEVNRRLFAGELVSKILAWLHEQPEVLKILDEHFGEEPISPQNMSEWKSGGYQDWLEQQEKVEQLGQLSEFALKLGQAAGGNINDGSAAILGGKILEKIEAATGDEVIGFTDAVVALRGSDLEAKKVKQRDRVLDQRERVVSLAEKQFQVRTCELFLTWHEDKRATEIAEGKGKKEVKIEQLRLLMFGAPPEEAKA